MDRRFRTLSPHQRAHRGQIRFPWLVLLLSAGVLLALVVMLALRADLLSPRGAGSSGGGPEPLVICCGAAAQRPVEVVAKKYEKECGRTVQLDIGSSQSLLNGIELTRRGDLFLPGDESYLRLARGKGLLAEVIPLAEMRAVIAVKKGNPRKIHAMEDLLAADLKIAQGDPGTAIAKLTRQSLAPAGKWEPLGRRTVVFKDTVNAVANDVLLGSVDAGIVWDATVQQYPGLEAVVVEELTAVRSRLAVGVLAGCQRPTEALRLARYLAARDRGQLDLAAAGFQPVPGDPWAETPKILFFSGAMLRPAIDATVHKFEQREGVKVTLVYNGCGILVSQMKAGTRPDAYFSCDRSFMAKVADLFVDSEDVSSNRLMILVKPGNPLGVKDVASLSQPGLRVGLADAEKSAMGAITHNMLRQMGLADALAKSGNVKVEPPTGDALVNSLLAGALDAVVVCRSNAVAAGDKVQRLPIDAPEGLAIQPVAPGKNAKYPQLTGRLVELLKSPQSRTKFESAGFQWQLGEKAAVHQQP
jgi:ABC-type molybdate transport system substrate-binding protein